MLDSFVFEHSRTWGVTFMLCSRVFGHPRISVREGSRVFEMFGHLRQFFSLESFRTEHSQFVESVRECSSICDNIFFVWVFPDSAFFSSSMHFLLWSCSCASCNWHNWHRCNHHTSTCMVAVAMWCDVHTPNHQHHVLTTHVGFM